MVNLNSFLPRTIYDSQTDPESLRPNYNERNGIKIDTIVIHYTVSNKEDSLKVFTKGRDVSVHYVIDEEGLLYQTVKEDFKAWHAGISSWKGKDFTNQNSIGIELINPGSGEQYCYPTIYSNKNNNGDCTKNYFPTVQISTLVDLLKDIKFRHGDNIPNDKIIGHSDIAPGRKIDPGAVFPWKVLANQGIGIDCNSDNSNINEIIGNNKSSTDIIQNIQQKLANLGYKISVDGVYNEQTANVIRAFKFHWQQDTTTGWGDWDTDSDNCINQLLGLQGLNQNIEL